jgi:hypothetical protein
MRRDLATLRRGRVAFRLAAIFGTVVLGFSFAAYSYGQRQQETAFPSPRAASAALLDAVHGHDTHAISLLVGETCGAAFAGSDESAIIESNDAAESVLLPKPVKGDGGWRFDAGLFCDEMLSSRIRRNESEVMRNLALAGVGGRLWSPTAPQNGYYYKPLDGGAAATMATGKAGVAAVVYPASYGFSGTLTFAVDREGAIFARDLGPNTLLRILDLERSRLDGGWQRITLTRLSVSSP